MTVAIKNDNRAPLVVPPAVRRKAGFKSGEEIEFRASGGVITIVAEAPNTPDDYTPAQRRVIDARLACADEDIKQGRVSGTFESAEEMAASIEANIKRLRAKKYCEAEGRWQARVNRNWRSYFKIIDDIYVIEEIIPHPK